MDDSTKNMALTLAAGIIKKGLVTLSAGAVTHGVIVKGFSWRMSPVSYQERRANLAYTICFKG